jgi:hypothetical protein
MNRCVYPIITSKDVHEIFYFLMNAPSEVHSYYSKDWSIKNRDGFIMIDRLNDSSSPFMIMLLEELKKDSLSH